MNKTSLLFVSYYLTLVVGQGNFYIAGVLL